MYADVLGGRVIQPLNVQGLPGVAELIACPVREIPFQFVLANNPVIEGAVDKLHVTVWHLEWLRSSRPPEMPTPLGPPRLNTHEKGRGYLAMDAQDRGTLSIGIEAGVAAPRVLLERRSPRHEWHPRTSAWIGNLNGRNCQDSCVPQGGSFHRESPQSSGGSYRCAPPSATCESARGRKSAGAEYRTATLVRLASCGCFTLVPTSRWLKSVLLGSINV